MKLFCNLGKKTIVITESQSKKIEETLAYHGSKMNFDEFNLAYMGTGVGAQEFGEGIYLTFDKEAAYGYGGTVYTVNIPDENKANYIYYDRSIPSDLFSAIIDNIITDITTQYPEEYEDEQSVKYLKKELYDILNPSEGRYLMYNIHRYIDDPIVIPKILKKAGVTGFIYNNGKVDNVIMFSSKDIKILDKETVNENKSRIEEEYFTPNELLTETKKYYVNMDVKVKEDSRTAPKMTPSELEDEFKKVWDKYNTENQSYRLGRFVYDMLRYNNPSNAPYKILKEFYKDMSKVDVDSENIDTIGDIRTTKSGISYVLCNKHGDWENPVLFMVYFDGNKVRGYIPEYGNCYNRIEKRAFGDPSDKDDKAFIKSQYPDKTDDEIYTIQNNLDYNKDACIEDFEKHIKVSGKYESKKTNVSESIDNDNDLINESYLIEAELKDIYPKYYSDISEKEFWEIIKADPTYNEQSPQKMGKYGKWLLNQYRHRNLDMNNLSEVKNILDFFNRYNRQLEKKDITQYKNVDQVYEAVKNYMADPTQATSKSDEARKIKEMGAEKVYEDKDWLIIVPKTQEAAIYYGKGTKWCTAASSSDNMFEYYNDQGRLYININKHTGDKYQFHFESDSFMDAEDNPIQGIIAEEIGLSRGAEQFYNSLGKDQGYEICYHDHGNITPQGEEEIFNRDGWRMVYNQNMFDLSIYNDNENEGYIINFDGSIEDMNGHPIKDPLYKFLPVFIIERLRRRYSGNVFYDMVLANYDPNDERPHQYFLLGNNGAVFQYYREENSGVLYRVDEQTYQFTIVIDAIRYDLRLEDEVSYNDNYLIFLDKYNKKLCYNVNTFTWEFNGSVDKLCEIDDDYAAAVKNGIGIVKIFKNNMTIEIPPYNNMPIYNLVLDYLYMSNLVFAEVKTEIPDDYQIAVYSVAKKQYVNDKLYDTYFPMPKYAALAMGYDVDYIEDIIDEYIILTKEEKDYLQSLYSKYGEIIYHCPDSSDQIIFANGNIITRRDFFKREKVYDFLMKVWNKQFEN